MARSSIEESGNTATSGFVDGGPGTTGEYAPDPSTTSSTRWPRSAGTSATPSSSTRACDRAGLRRTTPRMRAHDGTEREPRDESPERIRVGIAEWEVTVEGATLTTSGLGSCVGIALYDDETGVAGLVHVMLPTADGTGDAPAKFADTGTELLVERLEASGADRDDIVAKIAGGSDMLDCSEAEPGIGERNVEQVKATLEEHDIALVGEDVGGDHGRSVRLEAATGEFVVESARRGSRTL